MTVLKVPDMHCENCVRRITNALTEAKLGFTVSLKDQTVGIEGDEAAVKAAVAALDDIGFEAKQS
ncbi:MAG: heavy metal-associated domain-containing protein [Oscillospiraceae bacterium]|nr:heavy metal-associated domain-containing protein [Oscillospiraceae bacterium]